MKIKLVTYFDTVHHIIHYSNKEFKISQYVGSVVDGSIYIDCIMNDSWTTMMIAYNNNSISYLSKPTGMSIKNYINLTKSLSSLSRTFKI